MLKIVCSIATGVVGVTQDKHQSKTPLSPFALCNLEVYSDRFFCNKVAYHEYHERRTKVLKLFKLIGKPENF